MKNLLLPILLLASYSASCQITKPRPTPRVITLSVAEAAKIKDSLSVLPFVRQEARDWRMAATAYQHAADSLRRAGALQQDAARSYQQSLGDQQRLLTSATAASTEWRSKARKRGVINVLLVAVSGVLAFLAITR